ncbi:DUF927 domain-containing protein [Roseomonas sp. 18066]|uniref:DUF927 domain-containing protein n=1 Tax=Roseomonas sp. 18066 TaxID=2681412 RepID=UPI0013568EC8|nr:DUF927 domain-containing protein [Roseomonas sp. 18066]
MSTDTAAPERDLAAEALEITRLADMDAVSYARARKQSAQALGLTVGALDKAVQAELRRREADAAADYRKKAPPAAGEVRWPYGLKMRADGLHVDTGENGLLWLSAPFEVLGEAREASGDGWGLWLRWKDRDGREHTWPMPARLLMVGPGELEAALVERGLRVSPDPAARLHFRRALGEVQAGSRVTLVSRTGWHAQPGQDPAYVLADGSAFGCKTSEAMVLKLQAEAAVQLVAQAGTLEGWQQQIAAHAVGNDMAVAAIAGAFVGPLLEPLGEPSGGLHLAGRSKVGKTLALRLGLSVWGMPFKGGALRDWRSTANGLEGAAEESSDGLLGLDELHQADPREVASGIYMLANESGKGRMRRDTSAARRRTWRTFILSTGELDIGSVVAKAGQKLPAGAEVRLPSIPLPSVGNWPRLHGFASIDAMMGHLHAALRQQHGTAGRAFLASLIRDRATTPGALDQAAAAMRSIFAQTLKPDADAQVRDVARRFALISLAGELARAWGILPWPDGEATRAAQAMLAAWLVSRGGAGSGEEQQHLRAVRLFLLAHGASRFVALNKADGGDWQETFPDKTVPNRAGWRRRDAKGKENYLIPPVIWREVCAEAGIDPTETARTLRDQGMLEPGDGKNLAQKVRIPGLDLVRCYSVKADLLGDSQPAEVAA